MVFCHTYFLATSVSLSDKQSKQRIATTRMFPLLVLTKMFVYKQKANKAHVRKWSSKSAIFLNPLEIHPLHPYEILEILKKRNIWNKFKSVVFLLWLGRKAGNTKANMFQYILYIYRCL